uniref:Probable magnesium transporter n=1 Tax=Chenopodium quinoa TaxID=63459 RepID=A0A803KMC1_CHEQI
MSFSKDNVIGFGLALSSSGFIGASFIIKKKGLWKAGTSGVRAVIVGEVANFVAYAFAPAILVTPLGALSIIVSAVLAHFMLKERLNKLGFLGCVMCIVGSVIIVVHAPKEHSVTSVQEIWNMATQMAFLLYVGSVLVLVSILVLYFAPLCGHSNVLVFTGICSLMGSLSVMSVKALGISLKLTFEGNNQLLYPETWFFTVVLLTCVITQMNYLNKDWDGQDGAAIISEICGFIVVVLGTILLQMTKEVMEKLPSFKGNSYAPPMSPTLTAGLCAGNSDFLKCDWDDVENPEEVLLSRQYSYT